MAERGDDPEALEEQARQRVIEAAIAYCMGTNPDDHPLDRELREAVRDLTDPS